MGVREQWGDGDREKCTGRDRRTGGRGVRQRRRAPCTTAKVLTVRKSVKVKTDKTLTQQMKF